MPNSTSRSRLGRTMLNDDATSPAYKARISVNSSVRGHTR
uniref:Uncharacterized protein n=1 Tax=Aegilops tauschii subsp. strangulata TaxID=200361 RepID=A0A453SQG7_AEGTS